jgi:hypothetical protein
MTHGTNSPILTLTLRGPGVRKGRISVPDLIKICQEAQNAVNRQAEALDGRRTLHPGPTARSIQNQCTLELVAIKPGSTRLQFSLVKPQLPLPFEDFGNFGSQVVTELASSIQSLGNGNRKKIDPGVLRSLYGLGSLVDSSRISELEWIAPRHGKQKRLVAHLNGTVKARVAERLSVPRRAKIAIDGVLDMADFKPKERKCRIDPAIGPSITCTFSVEREAEVYALLRKPVRATGEAVLLPYTERVESMRIDTINQVLSLALEKDSFFASSSIEELAASQKVGPIRDVGGFVGAFPENEDIDDFLNDIYAARR